jgi:hypothetical protein
MLPTFQPRKPFHRRARAGDQPASAPPVPPVPLTLVSADYYEAAAEVILVFDREIDSSAFVGSAVTLDDGQFTFIVYAGSDSPFQDGPTTLRIPLLPGGSSSISGVQLGATALSGIVAADDGGTWPGVSGLVLPFP